MATAPSSKTSIPIFDLTDSDPALPRRLAFAAATYGFLFIKSTSNLPITVPLVNKAFTLSKSFFSSPYASKSQVPWQTNSRGWTSMGGERLDSEKQQAGDPKETFDFGEFVDGKAQQPMPDTLQGHEQDVNDILAGCSAMCKELLRLLAVGLEIEDGPAYGAGDGRGKNWFADRHNALNGSSGTILRMLYYPASRATSHIRAGVHSDYGSLTLLFRLPGQPGLEILNPDGDWESVPVQPAGTENDEAPPILVNIGDLLTYWTNGLLKSTIHRVVGSEVEEGGDAMATPSDRYSIAYFCHPCRDVELVPVPCMRVAQQMSEVETGLRFVGSGQATSGRLLTANEHLQGRLAAAYAQVREVMAN